MSACFVKFLWPSPWLTVPSPQMSRTPGPHRSRPGDPTELAQRHYHEMLSFTCGPFTRRSQSWADIKTSQLSAFDMSAKKSNRLQAPQPLSPYRFPHRVHVCFVHQSSSHRSTPLHTASQPHSQSHSQPHSHSCCGTCILSRNLESLGPSQFPSARGVLCQEDPRLLHARHLAV